MLPCVVMDFRGSFIQLPLPMMSVDVPCPWLNVFRCTLHGYLVMLPWQIDPSNAPHVGGNTWAGGTGGRDTAGLGGKGGPFRLDAGHTIYQLSDEEKRAVPPEVRNMSGILGITIFLSTILRTLQTSRSTKRVCSLDEVQSLIPVDLPCFARRAARRDSTSSQPMPLRNENWLELPRSRLYAISKQLINDRPGILVWCHFRSDG